MRTKTVERSILHYVNAERKKRGLPVLSGHPALIKAARSHSRRGAKTGHFEHTGADGSSPTDRASRAGYAGGVAENLWRSSTKGGKGRVWKSRFQWSDERELGKAAVISWMNSPGHRKNILWPDGKHIGIGVAEDKKGQAYFTQCFGNSPDLSSMAGRMTALNLRAPGSRKRPTRGHKQPPHKPIRLPRPLRQLLRRARRFPRRIRRMRWKTVAKRAAIGALVVYAGLTVFHLTNGLSFTDSLRGGFVDAQVTVSCFGEWGTIKQFVDRETLLGADVIGRVPPSEVCP